ncbi:hypothetical protein GOBAR_AA33712 [Gossypium barbadense]|uniref:RRM domain-containing protein n=1 Tax=Gossypium barbadense TaxID=3634 RepID=A0A2P5W7C9_GOSBA|nr:hypothetical protein GOBAR_AA33712 [Gossypium barbadense]
MDSVPPPTSYTGGPTSYPPSYGGPVGGYAGEGLSDVRTGGRGGPPGGYGSGGPRNQGGGYGGPPVEAPAKIKQCDGNCGDSCDNSRIYITNLPPDVTIEELRDLFGGIGQVGRIKQKRGYKDQWPWNIKIYTDDKGNQKGDAVLSYEDPQAAHSAGSFFNNHVIERLYDRRGYGREDCAQKVVKVATEVVATGAGIVTEMVVLGQIGITMAEIVHAHTESLSASKVGNDEWLKWHWMIEYTTGGGSCGIGEVFEIQNNGWRVVPYLHDLVLLKL